MLSALPAFVWNALRLLLEFLLALLLGFLGAVLYALPWLLRAASVLVWLAAGYTSLTWVGDFYAPLVSSPIPVRALQAAVIIILAAWVMLGLMARGVQAVWGLLAASGITVGGFFWQAAPWMLNRWPLEAHLFFRVLPSALFIVLLVFATLRLKSVFGHKGGDASEALSP
jgi:hypothetical protein